MLKETSNAVLQNSRERGRGIIKIGVPENCIGIYRLSARQWKMLQKCRIMDQTVLRPCLETIMICN